MTIVEQWEFPLHVVAFAALSLQGQEKVEHHRETQTNTRVLTIVLTLQIILGFFLFLSPAILVNTTSTIKLGPLANDNVEVGTLLV
mgnify:CR=1 FL=1